MWTFLLLVLYICVGAVGIIAAINILATTENGITFCIVGSTGIIIAAFTVAKFFDLVRFFML